MFTEESVSMAAKTAALRSVTYVSSLVMALSINSAINGEIDLNKRSSRWKYAICSTIAAIILIALVLIIIDWSDGDLDGQISA